MNIRHYQVDGVELFLSALDRSAPATRLLLDDPGLGKTVQAAEAYHLLPDRPAVIVCPAGLRQQWLRHLERHCGRQVYAAKSTKHCERDALKILETMGKSQRTGPAPALVISHENMTACATKGSPLLRLLGERTVLTLDEAHRGKGAKTKRGRATQAACQAVHAGGGAVWPMTATPMPASPIDLWVLLTWTGLAAHAFGDLHKFIVHFGGGMDPWTGRWVFPPSVPGGPLYQLQGLALRRRRADVLPELPPKRYELRLVEVEGATRRMLDQVTAAAAYACGMDPSDIDKITDLDRLSGLVLSFSHRLEALTEVRVALAAAKIPAMLRRVDELEAEGERIAVYSDHRAPIDALGGLDGTPARIGWKVIRGIESEKQRTAAVDHFRSGVDDQGKPVWGIGFTAAGREGHSLECAVRLLVVSSSWSAASEEQAEDRLCRFGRESEATIERFIAAHPIEIMQQRILAAKRMRATEALDAGPDSVSVLALPTALKKPQWLSDSRLKTELDCAFAGHVRYDLGLRPVNSPESRRLGVLFHAALEGRLLAWCEAHADPAVGDKCAVLDGPRAHELIQQKIKKAVLAEQWSQSKGTNEDDARTAVDLSLRTLTRFGFTTGRWLPFTWQGKPAVELDLRVPLPEFLTNPQHAVKFAWAGFVAKIDLVAYDLQHRGGTGQPRLTVVDFKCKENVSDGMSDGADDVQLMRYLAATRLVGMPTELAARIETKNKLPEEPEIKRGGKLSTAKANVTDEAMFLAAIARHGHKVEAYAEHLEWLKREGPHLFQMIQCGRTQAALDNVWNDVLYMAFEMMGTDRRPVRNLRSQRTAPCSSDRWQCEYKEVCTATLPGVPTPESYGNDLVQLGRLKRSSSHDYQTEEAAIRAALED